MEATLHQLGGILLSALPTFILVIFLHYYLKFMFFKPLEKVLGERHAATEGARALAVESLQRAERKTAEYEAAMRAERAKIYREFEQHHKRLQEEEKRRPVGRADRRRTARPRGQRGTGSRVGSGQDFSGRHQRRAGRPDRRIHLAPESRMKRLAPWILTIGLTAAAPASFAQDPKAAPGSRA